MLGIASLALSLWSYFLCIVSAELTRRIEASAGATVHVLHEFSGSSWCPWAALSLEFDSMPPLGTMLVWVTI